MRKSTLSIAALALLWTGSAIAGVKTFDFNTDPVASGEISRTSGNYAWYATGGVTNSGYASITSGVSQKTVMLFDDIDNGLLIQAFTFECDLRVGDGTADPADGFSINYARANDPVALDINGAFATGPNCEANLPEEGTQTGIAIGLDTWFSGGTAPYCGEADQSIGQDIIAISVRVDGLLVLQSPMPTKNPTDGTDPTSLQTGPRSTANPGSGELLTWQHLKVQLGTDGKLNVFWKGKQILNNYQTSYFPSAGQLIFSGRCGDAWEIQQVDNIRLETIPATDVLVGGGAATPIGGSMIASDSGASVAQPNTVKMYWDGAEVTPKVVTKTNASTYVTWYDVNAPLVAGSTHKIGMTIMDNAGKTVGATNEVTIPAYVTIPATFAANNVDQTKPGFGVKVHWLPAKVLGYELENTTARAERQLAGKLGQNQIAGSGGQTTVTTEPSVVNFSWNTLSATDMSIAPQGYFHTNVVADLDWPDTAPFGIDVADGVAGSGKDNSGVAAAFETYVYFPETGVYTIIFNSDDGFRTTASPNPSDIASTNSINVATQDVGRGATDTATTLYIPAAGYYPFRTVWFQGGGGANCEWSASESLPTVRARRLINDLVNPDALKSFAARTSNAGLPPAISFIDPAKDSGNSYKADVGVELELADGAATVDQASIKLNFDGVAVTPTVSKTGSKTKVTYQPPAMLASGSRHGFDVSFTSGGVTYAATNTFTVVSYIVLAGDVAMPASAVDINRPGFLIKTIQALYDLGGWNIVERGNYQVDGYIAWPNVADLTPYTLTPEGYLSAGDNFITYINENGWKSAGGKFDGTTYTEVEIPGIPTAVAGARESGRDDFSQEVLTVLDLKAGWYCMGVTSDDGCEVTFGNPKEKYSAVRLFVDRASVGRGMDDGSDASWFFVEKDGLYPTRLMWFQGGGGAGAEWYLHDIGVGSSAVGATRRLINNIDDAKAVKAYEYPIASAGVPWVATYGPTAKGLGNHVAYDAPVSASIVEGIGTIDTATVKLKLDGASVTPTVSKQAGVVKVEYKPTSNWGAGDHTVSLTFGTRTLNWTFTIGTSLVQTPVFWFESEDYDFGGQTLAAANVMPYKGGAFANKFGVPNVDYSRGDNSDAANNKFYRNYTNYEGTGPRMPMQLNQNDLDRGGVQSDVNFRLGWIGNAQWYNYTRTVPAGKYNIYVAASNGGTDNHGEYAHLRQVMAGVGTPNQETQLIGIFDGKGTGGWGLNTWVPLKDWSGSLVQWTSPGTPVTFRYDLPNAVTNIVNGVEQITYNGNGDVDYLVFVPAAVGQPRITAATVTGGNITITWSGGGTLEWATAVNATAWTSTGNSTGTYTEAIGAGNKFFRVKQ